MNEKVDHLEQQLATVVKEIGGVGEAISAGFTKVDTNFSTLKIQIETLQKKVDAMVKEIEQLKGETSEGFDDVGIKIESLTDEIIKIGKVTDYEDQFRNLQGLSKN